MTFDELKGIASPFCADPDHDHVRSMVFARPGEIAASDGRILIHIESPEIAPPADKELPSQAVGVLNFRPEGDEVVLAHREWIAAQSAKISPAWQDAYEEYQRRVDRFDDDPDTYIRREGGRLRECPCCGEALVVQGDDVTTYGQWLTENRPSEWYDISGNVRIRVPGEPSIYVSLRYMHIALVAAECLGGADTMSLVGGMQLVFRGKGWFVTMMRMRTNGGAMSDIVATLDIKEGGAE